MWTFATVTETVPATPTVPPPAPAVTPMTDSCAFAVIEMSFFAFTFAPLPMYA